jgi:nitrite reductase/ring-hydroxylating ferredoxin subunit
MALVNVDGEVFAIESNCPHQGGPLARGQLDGEVVTCPWHGWRWNVKTGRAVWPPVDWRVPRYETRLEGEDILVRKR